MLRGAELRERRRHRLAIVACKRVWSQPVSKRATREQPRVARGDGGGGGRGGESWRVPRRSERIVSSCSRSWLSSERRSDWPPPDEDEISAQTASMEAANLPTAPPENGQG